MTNPNDAVGTNAAYGGRTSTNAFNDDLAPYNRGILTGWACVPNSGMTVSLGGDGSTRDVAVAEDNAGNKTTINNISGSPVDVTMAAAPASNSRIDAVVAYVDNPAQGSSSVADNPSACGIIAVQGTAASSPVVPSEAQIRSAITADGASGTTAYYVVLAYITIASGTTDIVSGDISQTKSTSAQIQTIVDYFNFSTVTNPNVNVTNASLHSAQTEVTCFSNANGTAGRIYGRISCASTGSSSTITFATPFRPDTTTVISGIAVNQWSDDGNVWSNLIPSNITIATNGTATMTISGSVSGRERRFTMYACLLFIKPLGDEI